jgi:hypothetical protein
MLWVTFENAEVMDEDVLHFDLLFNVRIEVKVKRGKAEVHPFD